MAKETAEQKLLKMMQKFSSGDTPVANKTSSAPKLVFAFSMQTLNQILMIGIVVCIASLIYEMRSGFSLLNKEVDFSGDIKAPRNVSDMALPSSKNIKYYLDKISARNIFRPFDAQVNKAAPGQQNLAKRLAKYKLVGVAWLDLPQSASIMIEDTGSKSTYFLKQGEQLEGVTVKTIYTDRAVFSYENEETIIKL